jgi:hypothetical protein
MAAAFSQYTPMPNGPSDLWILPPPASSNWFARIDWYLNWQLSKGLTHSSARPSMDLLRIMEAGELSPVEVPMPANPPLMVISMGRIAATKCVVVKLGEKPEQWFSRLAQVIEQLSARHVNIFLPSGISVGQAEKIWRSQRSKAETVQFVIDEGAGK